MEDAHVARLEDRLQQLERSLAEVSRRVASLEGSPAPPAVATAAVHEEAEPAGRLQAGTWSALQPTELVALIGRAVLVLGGGYFLRAVTEAGSLPASVGVLLGLAYAAAWCVAADRAAAPGRRAEPSATFHAVAACALAVPILYEATARFALLTPPAAGLGLATLGVAVAAVAWRRGVRAVAWAGALATVFGAFALMAATRATLPFLACLLLQSLATLAYAADRGWRILRWVVAVPTTVAVLALTELAVTGRTPHGQGAVVAGQLAFLAVYLFSFAGARLRRPLARLGPFEGVLTFLALALGLGGAARVVEGSATTALGLFALGLAAGSYLLAARTDDSESVVARHFVFGAGALLAVLIGGLLLCPSGPLAILLGIGAVVATATARHGCGALACSHGALYLGGAAALAGLLRGSVGALTAAPAAVAAIDVTLAHVAVLAASAVMLWLLGGRPGATAAASRALALGVLIIGLMMPAVVIATSLMGAEPGLATLAAIRTIPLALGAVALTSARRWMGLREAGWLVPPLLLGIGLKLVLDDLPNGRPATQFVALGLYGAALILAARWGRQASDPGVTVHDGTGHG